MQDKKSISGDNFAARLRDAMDRKGLSAADVARSLRTTPSTVFGWLQKSAPRRRALEDLATLLGVTTDWLTSGAPNEFVNESSIPPNKEMPASPEFAEAAWNTLVGSFGDAQLLALTSEMLAEAEKGGPKAGSNLLTAKRLVAEAQRRMAGRASVEPSQASE